MTGAHVDDRTAVLEARNVSLDFDGTDSSGSKVTIHALDRVNLTIHRGEITALVGESGSGKTSIARLFALIYKPTSGELYRNGEWCTCTASVPNVPTIEMSSSSTRTLSHPSTG